MAKKNSTEKTSFLSSFKKEVEVESPKVESLKVESLKVESPKVRPGSFASLISQ